MERIDPSKRYTWWRKTCYSEWIYYVLAGDILDDVPNTLSGAELAALVKKFAAGPDCAIRWREIAD